MDQFYTSVFPIRVKDGIESDSNPTDFFYPSEGDRGSRFGNQQAPHTQFDSTPRPGVLKSPRWSKRALHVDSLPGTRAVIASDIAVIDIMSLHSEEIVAGIAALQMCGHVAKLDV